MTNKQQKGFVSRNEERPKRKALKKQNTGFKQPAKMPCHQKFYYLSIFVTFSFKKT